MLLLLLIMIPILGSMICCILNYINFNISRWIALLDVLLVFFLSIFLWCKICYFHDAYLYHNHWNKEFQYSWIPILGIDLHFAIDILSLIMVILSSFICIISVLSAWDNIKNNSGIFYANVLMILGGTIGVFLSIDLFLFFCFWEIMLIPVYFLMVFWGEKKYAYEKRIYTANVFLIYTQISSLIMLFSILMLSINYYYYTHVITFNYNNLIQLPISHILEFIIMLGFFIAFAVKMPIFPFHTWLPNMHSQSPCSGIVDLSGLLIKVSAYGLLRFNMTLFHYSSFMFSYIAIFLGLITIFYSLLMAFCEKNIKKIIAYNSMSHMGLILIAIYCENRFSYYGVVFQILFSTLSTSALFILCSQLYYRIGVFNIFKISGIHQYIEWLPSFFLFFILSNLNFPGTANFIGELMILLGVCKSHFYLVILLVLSLLCSVCYSLRILHKIFYGSTNSNIKHLKKINYREFSIIMILIFITILFGLFPQFILKNLNF